MGSRGFSLVEAVIVLSIISIVTLVAAPPFLSWKRNAEIRGAAAQLTTSLQLARNYALINQEYVVIRFGSKQYRIFVDNGNGGANPGDWLRSGEEKLLCLHGQPSGVELSTSFPHDKFRFKGFGRNRPGTVTMSSSNGRTIKIIVNVLGRVRAEFE